MHKLDSVLNNVFDVPDFNCFGTTVQTTDTFITLHGGECYLVMILERSNLDGSNARYEYALYSLTSDVCIRNGEAQFNQVTKGFPSLKNADASDARVDYWENKRLQKIFEELVDRIAADGGPTLETMELYETYLADMVKQKSTSFRKVYQYFQKLVEL